MKDEAILSPTISERSTSRLMQDASLSPACPPVAWVLCEDARLFRFLAIELAHLGLEATAPAADDRLPCLAVADTDRYPVAALCAEADPTVPTLPPDCPLLGFGYDPADIPAERGLWLARPFALTALEVALRHLSADAARTASPLQPAVSPPSAMATLAPENPVSTPLSPASAIPELDEAKATVTIGERTIPLTPAELAILAHLVAHRGETVTRDALASRLGGGGNSVEVYICHLRRKLEKPLGRRMIRTVRGQGYCLDE